MFSKLWLSNLIVLGFVATGCVDEAPRPSPSVVPAAADRTKIHQLATQHLPNAVRIHPKVISGGLPEGLAAFEELRALGVQTVISVDGAQPDLVSAEKCGLRYVHLPHGYDGIPRDRGDQLAKAVHDLPGQIYIHCHHGKHRSPAAAAVACVSAGFIDPSVALSVLQVAGTSPNYRGLFESARLAEPLTAAALKGLAADFPASAKLPAMAESMVAIEQTHEHLKAFSNAGWKTLPKQPDLSPEHEALLLREHFAELARTADVQQQPVGFRQLLDEGENLGRKLEDQLRTWVAGDNSELVPEPISTTFKAVNDNCKACHQKFRDVPLSEKRL